jgi:serine/threonine-protein kinase
VPAADVGRDNAARAGREATEQAETKDESSTFRIRAVLQGARRRPAIPIAIIAVATIVTSGFVVGAVIGRGRSEDSAARANGPAGPAAIVGSAADARSNGPPPAAGAAAPSAPDEATAVAADASAGDRSDGAGGGPPDASPPPATAAAPAMARIELVTDPEGLNVLIDGAPRGTSPLTLDLEPGDVTFELLSPSLGVEYAKTLSVAPGERGRREIAVPTGRIALRIYPWANVWINGRKVGLTPMSPVQVYAGRHNVKLENGALGKTILERVVVRPGGRATVSVDLTKAR